jgi:hypothetical protein
MRNALSWYVEQVTQQPLRLRGRLLLTVSLGMALACLLSVLTTIAFVAKPLAFTSAAGVGFGAAIGGYLLMGFVAGGLAGLLLPLGRRWFGAALLGFVVAFVCWTVVGLLSGDKAAANLRMALELGAAFGPALGFYVWYLVRHPGR